MKNSDPIKAAQLANGKSVFVTFIHTDNYTCIAEVTADNTAGCVRMILNTPGVPWVFLDDTLDRVVLFEGGIPHRLLVDVDKIYHDYTVEQFVT